MKLFLGGTKDEDKRMAVKLKLSSSQKLPLFEHISKKINTFIFQCMVIPLDPHSIRT
jgi:hypothetical protein